MENKQTNRPKVKRKKWKYYSAGDKIFLIIVYLLLFLIAFLCLYPLYFTVIASVSDPASVFSGKVSWFPYQFSLKSYELVFRNTAIWRGYANSVFYTVVGTIFNLVLTIPAAYALSKKEMFGRSVLMFVFVFTMYFGGGLIPTYLLFKSLNLINTRWILILNGGVSVYNIIVTRTYFQNNIPESLPEAARIDGASEIGIFFRIALPLSTPIIAVITLYYAVAHWSSYFPAMIYTSNVQLQPLQLVLRNILIMNQTIILDAIEGGDEALINDMEQRAYIVLTMKYALVFIASAPMLIAYPFVQKYFVKGIMIGSVKG